MRLIAAAAALVVSIAAPAAADWRTPLEAELAAVHRAVDRYRDVAVAETEGWRIFGGHGPAMGEHWNHKERRPQLAGEPLDLARPMNLIYSEIDGRRELIGLTYGYRLGPRDPLPEGFSGPLDRWHVHDFDTIVETVMEERPGLRWIARRWLDRRYAPDGRTRLAMVHVWLDGRNPEGPFADRYRPLSYIRLGLGPRYWQGGSLDAAYGLALAAPEGCQHEKGKLWISGTDRARKRQLLAACETAANRIRAALGAPPAALNRAAELAWRGYDATLQKTLTEDEQARIAAMVEHPHADHLPQRETQPHDH